MNISINKRPQRIVSIDLLKTIACAFVILIHTQMASKYESFIYIAVPIFIIITGYNYSASFTRRKNDSLKQCYAPSNLMRMLTRILVPYAVFIAAQQICVLAVGIEYKPLKIITSCLTGGFGPGNYFLYLFIQLLFVFPILFYFNRKNPKITAICCFVIFLVYEIIMHSVFPNMQRGTDIGSAIYKYLFIRYLFFLESGAFIYFYGKKTNILVFAALLAAGIAFYAIECCTLTYDTFLDNNSFSAQSFSIGLVGLCIVFVPGTDGAYAKPLTLISSASWHIFLTQQLYFYTIENVNVGFLGINGIVDIIICFTVGIAFYYAEGYAVKLSRKLAKRRR